MLSGQQLVQLFRLSPAEARLARALALGKTPEEFATECELSMATVRTQLRKVFEKTGTARQAELMKLLVSVPPTRD
jgi:DNA-binding CsgD family transcriptional regulator